MNNLEKLQSVLSEDHVDALLLISQVSHLEADLMDECGLGASAGRQRCGL